MAELVAEVLVLPDGMDLSDQNLAAFALRVRWRGVYHPAGRGGYTVMHGDRFLSRTGFWRADPAPNQQFNYRWPTLTEAIGAGRAVVNGIRVNKMTYAEYSAQKDHRK